MKPPHDFLSGTGRAGQPPPADTGRRSVEHDTAVGNDDAGLDRMRARRTMASAVRTIDSSQLLGGLREVHIVHAGETYRLLVTRNNRLILQK